MLNEEVEVGQFEAAEVQCGVVFAEVLHLLVDFVAGQLGLFVDLLDFEGDAVVLSVGGFLCCDRSDGSWFGCWRRRWCFNSWSFFLFFVNVVKQFVQDGLGIFVWFEGEFGFLS